MKNRYLLALGGNKGEVLDTFESAARSIQGFAQVNKCAPPCQSPALLPENAPSEWNSVYWNTVIEIDCDLEPKELLKRLQAIELEFGRQRTERWAPRTLDIDIVDMHSPTQKNYKDDFGPDLQIPHPATKRRSFVLGPLSWIRPYWQFSGDNDVAPRFALNYERTNKFRLPAIMGIVNVTPNSFSDGGKNLQSQSALATAESMRLSGAQYVDLGAESTGPDAQSISLDLEWERLFPVLRELQSKWSSYFFRPKISIDTRNALTAEKAIEFGADVINDVSGFKDPRMLEIAKQSEIEFIAMHSLTVPASRSSYLAEEVPVEVEVRQWAETTLKNWKSIGLPKERLILDPGIGFGKKPNHSWQLMAKIQQLIPTDIRVMVGHSRKSFLGTITEEKFADRDIETLGVSLTLVDLGVDILRVHDVDVHRRALHAKLAIGNYA